MKNIFHLIESFLNSYCKSSAPVLLALSGGADSLCLFHCLLLYRDRYGLAFHIAHVDHSWRKESKLEAEILQRLAKDHCVPFHLKILNPAMFNGNLEASCRNERYIFFKALCQEYDFQGVLTGHHQNDQAETIFKRILEGSHWSRWPCLKSETWMEGIRILRPLLNISKKEIQKALIENHLTPFEDPTNHNLCFLRSRLRKSIFPKLNRNFGKDVQKSLIEIGKEMGELSDYFENHLNPLLDSTVRGPWGSYLDLQYTLPEHLLEIKFLIRLFNSKEGCFFSREIIEQVSQALKKGAAARQFIMGSRQLYIDRRRIFLLSNFEKYSQPQFINTSLGTFSSESWQIKVSEDTYCANQKISWKEAWEGKFHCYLPKGNYTINFLDQLPHLQIHLSKIKKHWSHEKVPSFLYRYFPLVLQDQSICHEFLTGKQHTLLNEGDCCWKFDFSHSIQD